MRKDVLGIRKKENHVILDNSSKINSTSNQTTSATHSPPTQAVHHLTDDNEFTYQSGNNTRYSRGLLYKPYDPEVGLNTASFLGGLLLFLVVYVVYRTKCRKRLLKAVQNCSMKYFPGEFPPPKPEVDQLNKNGSNCNMVDSEWLSEGAKQIWQDRAKLSIEPDIGSGRINDQASCYNGDIEYGDGELIDEVNVVRNHRDGSVHLPEFEENIEKATAQWIQNCKEMDPKEKRLNGIILKIPPDLVSRNAKIRSHFHSVTDYVDNNTFVNISERARNKSLPLLTDPRNLVSTNYAKKSFDENCKSQISQNCVKYAPLATQEELDHDAKPNDLHVQHQSGSKVPLDICPIVRVQHYHSRSKRRLTSINRASSEESSSESSSDEACLVRGQGHSVGRSCRMIGQAKYQRLNTDDVTLTNNINNTIHSLQKQNNKVSKMNRLPNNHPKQFPAGNLETSL